MTSFIALYRGDTVASAELIAVTNDPRLVSEVASRILQEPGQTPEATGDPVRQPLSNGRRQALEAVIAEAGVNRENER